MIYDHRRDSHGDMGDILLYASPNVRAAYRSDNISATYWEGDYPKCCACGRTRGHFAVHHEPPRSKGALVLETASGMFVVKPALLLLCEECHRDRHDRALLSFRWEFASDEDEERFLTGALFREGFQEHDSRLWDMGRLIATHRGREFEVRP